MRKLLMAGLALVILAPSIVLAVDVLDVDQSKYVNAPGFLGYVPDRFVVVLRSDVAIDHGRDARAAVALTNLPGFDALAGKYQVQRLQPQFPGADRGSAALTAEGTALARHYKVTIGNGTLEDAMADYAALPDVERVEPIGIHTLYATPNDTYYDDPPQTFPYDQWHYWDTYGIEADQAWDDETGSQAVLVGDLDIGCKYDHGDLGGSNPPGPNDASTNGNIWVNTSEIPGNGIDDDGNGYVDDIIGWDFVDRTDWYIYTCTDLDCGGADNDPSDGDGHGTHTAGTIAAITNNGYAVAGVAGGYGNGTFSGGGNGVKVVPCRIGYRLRYLGQDVGVVIMDYVAEAMYYMAELKIAGWNVAAINCSFGSSNSGGLSAACDYLIAQDVMVIVAAGNSNSSSPDYLGARTDCMDVGATDENGNPASFSNYGSWVEVAAPGVAVMSTITDPTNPTADYVAVMDGTSMACPHVVGVAALLESFDPGLTALDKWNLIVNNTKPYNKTKNVGIGIVDVRACLDALGPVCDLAADFSGSPVSGCAPLTVNFTDLSTGTGIDGWSWTFGDGGTSTAQDPSHTYAAAGTYNVSLTITSSSQGCNDIQTKNGYVTVNAGPTANFVGSPTSGTAPLSVNFTDQSTNATGWSWNFGDGGTSALQNPSRTFTAAGTYTVTLTAGNACGSDVEQKVDYITVSPCVAPVADFSGSPTTGVAPLTVNFTDLSSGDPTSWSWTFGDGGTSTQQNPSHAYTAAGTYTVSMSASNGCGSDAVTRTDYITVTAPQAAKAYASADISVLGTYTGSYTDTYISDNVRETITEALSTSHPRKVTSEAEHKWTFAVAGGGSNCMFYVEAYRSANTEGDNFTFAYSIDDVTYTTLVTVTSTTEQVYSAALPILSGTVYVRVTDANRSWGNTSLDAVYIDEMYIQYETTPGPPVAGFAGSPTSGPAPLTVSFTDLSTGGPTSWAWTFGDGGTSTARNPSHTYVGNGTYTVSLTAANAYGSDGETKLDYITVADQSTAMHVHNMVVGRTKVAAYYYGTCTVTICDGNNQAVQGATVYVTASGPSGGSYSGVTAADGTISFQTASGEKKPVGEWCFEVTNVAKSGWTYDSGANDVTRACESGWVYGSGGGDMAMLDEPLPSEYGLAQNHPNPFNPTTEITFALPQSGRVTLDVFNIAGQKVATLVDGVYPAGEFSVSWDASGYSSGIYLYRLTTGDFVQTRKMVLLK
jgi:PKD repeat protein